MGTRFLNRPYYLFRPTQVVRRLAMLAGRNPSDVVLPWGMSIRFDPGEAVGSSIARTGLYDVTVCEALFRLADPGELAVDVGANIGVMTSVLAHRVGLGGEVIAVEPHPATSERLAVNVERWRDAGTITVVRRAISDRSGTTWLRNPTPDVGTATLRGGGEAVAEVACVSLDELLGVRSVGVLKLDVEGHEEAVLRGAREALAGRRIRDVVFEDLGQPPTAVTRLLEEAGYSVYKLDCRPLRLTLAGIDPPARHRVWEPPSYLATLDALRAHARIGSWGWHALRSG